jgi:hypothetical protein
VPEDITELLPHWGGGDACAIASDLWAKLMWRISVDPMYRRQDGWRRPAGLTIEAVKPLRFLAAIDADWNFTRILVRMGLQRQPARPAGRKA